MCSTGEETQQEFDKLTQSDKEDEHNEEKNVYNHD
jgi:hypothetical protein